MALIPLELDKEYGLLVLSAIRSGDPVPLPPSGKWRSTDSLAVAGAMLFATWSHGPVLGQSDLSTEQRAISGEEFIAGVASAGEFMSRVFSYIADGAWDFQSDTLRGVLNTITQKVTIDDQ